MAAHSAAAGNSDRATLPSFFTTLQMRKLSVSLYQNDPREFCNICTDPRRFASTNQVSMRVWTRMTFQRTTHDISRQNTWLSHQSNSIIFLLYRIMFERPFSVRFLLISAILLNVEQFENLKVRAAWCSPSGARKQNVRPDTLRASLVRTRRKRRPYPARGFSNKIRFGGVYRVRGIFSFCWRFAVSYATETHKSSLVYRLIGGQRSADLAAKALVRAGQVEVSTLCSVCGRSLYIVGIEAPL